MEKTIKRLYDTVIEQVGNLPKTTKYLDPEERFEIERIKTITNFLELIIASQNYGLIASDIGEEFHKRTDIAIQSNDQELKSLADQFDTSKQGLELYSVKLNKTETLNDHNRKTRKLKEIRTSRYRQKLDEMQRQLNNIIVQIFDVKLLKEKNQQLIMSFDNNPETFVQESIEKEYYNPEEFLTRQLELLLQIVKDNIGNIILKPGYSDHSLTENGHLNVPLIHLVVAYVQTGKSELLDKVRENRECRIEIAKSHYAIQSLNDIKRYFENDYFKDLKNLKYYSQQLDELKKQKKSLFSNPQRDASITFLEQKIREFGHKLRSIIDQIGKSNLLEDESFLSLLGLTKNDIITIEQNTVLSTDDGAPKSYHYINSAENSNKAYGNLLSTFSASPQAVIAKLDELINNNQKRIEQNQATIEHNQTEVPECAQVTYSDIYRLEYYGHITRTKEADRCVKLLETCLQLLAFYKSGERLDYNQEHFNTIANEILNIISEKLYVSEEYISQTSLTSENSPKHYN